MWIVSLDEVTRQNAELLRLGFLVGEHSKAFDEMLKGLQRAVPWLPPSERASS